eukprot:g3544.t1
MLRIAAQQLRTRGCKRCSFFLYSKTEPVIEASEDLAFAPWSASYPSAKAHFNRFGFNPVVALMYYNPATRLVTFEALCAAPLESGESCGQSVGTIPQTRPSLPPAPPDSFKEVSKLHVQDGAELTILEQVKHLGKHESKAAASSSHKGGLAMAALAGQTLMEAPERCTLLGR